jgi:hypothetical protein
VKGEKKKKAEGRRQKAEYRIRKEMRMGGMRCPVQK